MQASSSTASAAASPTELGVAELVEHRHHRDGDKVRIVVLAKSLALRMFHHLRDQTDRQRTDVVPVLGEVVADHGQLRDADDLGQPVAVGVPVRGRRLIRALPVRQPRFGGGPRTFPGLIAEPHGPFTDHGFFGVVVVVERRGGLAGFGGDVRNRRRQNALARDHRPGRRVDRGLGLPAAQGRQLLTRTDCHLRRAPSSTIAQI